MSYRDLRGDNLHNMMIDPSTVNSRVYIGNIPTNELSKRDIEDRFQKYGPILGISLNRGFGFVQFEHESHAAEAIKHENGVMFRGKKMEVNPARVYGGRNRGGGGSSSEPRGAQKGDLDDRDPFRDRSPIDDRGRERDWRDRDRYDNFSGKGGMDRGNYYGRESSFGKDSATYPGQDKFRSGSNVSTGRDDRSTFGKDPFSGAGSFRPGGVGNGRGAIPPRDYMPANNVVNPLERTNDCEIIVFNKSQREYAEYIERRLKQLDITVDLLFPNEEVPISRILANISSRGSLYAISVMPQNEEHRSLTLNILHGLPQEHRNMPLEDAVPLIKRNFEAYRNGEKSGLVAAGAVGGVASAAGGAVPTAVAVAPAGLSAPPASDRHPEAIQVLLSLLADNRQLTVLQYDRVLRYLQERRELQLKLELGDAKDLAAPASSGKGSSALYSRWQSGEVSGRSPTARVAPQKASWFGQWPSILEPATKQQVDLQHRILNILNNQSTSTTSAGAVGHTTAVSAGSVGSMASMVGGLGSAASMSGLSSMSGLGMSMAGAHGLAPSLNIAPVPAPVAPPSGNWQGQSSTSTPLLSDPTVQKALDSLMQGNLLRKITPTSGSSTSGISSLGAPSQPLFSSSWGSGASKM